MAAPTGVFKARPYFLVLVGLIVVLYALVFLTPNHKPNPKLGLDLVGGTSVTMQAQTLSGAKPNAADLNVARDIIAQRVNSTGVSEAEVFVQNGRDIVVNVAGQNEADRLKAAARAGQARIPGGVEHRPGPAEGLAGTVGQRLGQPDPGSVRIRPRRRRRARRSVPRHRRTQTRP